MNKTLFLTILSFGLLILPSRICHADSFGYNSRVTIIGENSRFSAVHFHDWSSRTNEQRWAISFNLKHHEQIFSPSKNGFAYLKLFDKVTGALVFRAPTPALTYLWISPDSKYVVGLSNIKLLNPYQIVVFTVGGKLLYKEHISDSMVAMTQPELDEFSHLFPRAKSFLSSRIQTIRDKNYIDVFDVGGSNIIGDRAFHRLLEFRQPNPYSKNFAESVTNHIYWFNENPQIEIREEKGYLNLQLTDPAGKPFDVVIHNAT